MLSFSSSMNSPPLSLIFSHPHTNPQLSPLHPSSTSSLQHTPFISPFPLLILLILPSFHHSSSFPSLFSLKARSNHKRDFKFCPNKVTSVKNLYQGTLIPLILCDRSSFPKNLLLLRICVNPRITSNYIFGYSCTLVVKFSLIR